MKQMTKYEIKQKRDRDLYHKNRDRAFRSLKRATKDFDELREYRRKYDLRNRFMVEYMDI